MIKSITCPSCSTALAWFDTVTGCIRDAELPKGMKVFGAYLTCEKCGKGVKFDGVRAKRQLIACNSERV